LGSNKLKPPESSKTLFLPRFRKLFLDPVRKKHHNLRYDIVRDLIQECGRNILDVGCGAPARCMRPGSFLRKLGYGKGIDIIQWDIEFDFCVGDIRNIPFADAEFDAVTAIEVIEHLPEPSVALHEIHRVLKKDGVFVVTTPNNNIIFSTLWWIWERSFGDEWKHDHLVTYNKKEWLKIFAQEDLFRAEKILDYWGISLIVKLRKI